MYTQLSLELGVYMESYIEYEWEHIIKPTATELGINPLHKKPEQVLIEIRKKCPSTANIIDERRKLKDDIFKNQAVKSLFEPQIDPDTGEVVESADDHKLKEYSDKLIKSRNNLSDSLKSCQ